MTMSQHAVLGLARCWGWALHIHVSLGASSARIFHWLAWFRLIADDFTVLQPPVVIVFAACRSSFAFVRGVNPGLKRVRAAKGYSL
jgi:hypothetical protein